MPGHRHPEPEQNVAKRRVLHIGIDSKGQSLPSHYRDYERVCFDINPRQDTELVGDARDLAEIANDSFDAVRLCRLLEYYHPWEVPQVLREATRVVKVGGFVDAQVPDARAIFQRVIDGHPVDAALYHGEEGPMTPQNLVHGRIGRTRNAATFMAHRTLFTLEFLQRELRGAGLAIELDGICTETPFHCFCIGRKRPGEETGSIDRLLESLAQPV